MAIRSAGVGGEREKSRSNLGMFHLTSSKFLKDIFHCSTQQGGASSKPAFILQVKNLRNRQEKMLCARAHGGFDS